MTDYVHIRGHGGNLPSTIGNLLRRRAATEQGLCGARFTSRTERPVAGQGAEPAMCPNCLIAQATPRGRRLWRIEHGLTTHVQALGTRVYVSIEETLALGCVLIATLVLVPLPWAIVTFWIAGAVLHIWLHSNDRCAGGCRGLGQPDTPPTDDERRRR